jgi:hypothetical protein
MEERDSSGQRYVEIETVRGEKVRITLVTKSDYTDEPRFRFQIHDGNGLRPGPEIPSSAMGEVFGGVMKLVSPF